MNLRRIYRNATVGTLVFAALGLVYGGWRFPAGVIAGGVLGMLNLRGMARGLEALTSDPDPKARIMARSLVRLLALGAVIVLLALTRTVHLVGLLVGFIVVLTCTVTEGFFSTRRGGA